MLYEMGFCDFTDYMNKARPNKYEYEELKDMFEYFEEKDTQTIFDPVELIDEWEEEKGE